MEFLEILYKVSLVFGAFFNAAGAALSLNHARKARDNSLFFMLLAGFYTCLLMSFFFYIVSWFLGDYPFVFSPGDLSWIGAIIFLITADVNFTDQWTDEQKKNAKKYRLPALAGPAVCAAFNTAYIRIYPELLFNDILYFIPTAILSYLALWLWLTEKKSGKALFHLTTLGWLGVQLFYDLFSNFGWDYGFAVHEVICSYLLVAVSFVLYFAAKRERALQCT